MVILSCYVIKHISSLEREKEKERKREKDRETDKDRLKESKKSNKTLYKHTENKENYSYIISILLQLLITESHKVIPTQTLIKNSKRRT